MLTHHLPSLPGAELDPAVKKLLDSAVEQGHIAEGQCDAALLATLASFEPAEATTILTEFMEAAPTSVQNKAGFLCSIMKRHREAAGPAAPPGTNTTPVREFLKQLHDAGKFDMHKMDECIIQDLEAMPPGGGTRALELYAAADHASIRNMSGFMKGIINKLRREGFGPPGQRVPIDPPSSGSSWGQPPGAWTQPGKGKGKGDVGGKGGFGGKGDLGKGKGLEKGCKGFGKGDDYGTGGDGWGKGDNAWGKGGDGWGKGGDSWGKGGEGWGKGDGGWGDDGWSKDDGWGKGGESYGKGGNGYGKGGDTYGKGDDLYGKGGDTYGKGGDPGVYCPACGLHQPHLNFCSGCGYDMRQSGKGSTW